MRQTSQHAPTVLVVPRPVVGGGPTNAVLRVFAALSRTHSATLASGPLSRWDVLLLNVALGIQCRIATALARRRRRVYRVDGSYSPRLFAEIGRRPSDSELAQNGRIAQQLASADFVIYQSRFAKRYLDELFARESGTFAVIPNGVDTTVFRPPESRPQKSRPVLLSLGTFRGPRVSVLMEVSNAVRQDHDFLLVGRMDDSCRAALSAWVSRTRAGRVVRWIGQVRSDEELARVYGTADVFVHPVAGDTCSNAVIEAMACGLPVVLPEHSGSAEVVGSVGVHVSGLPSVGRDDFAERAAEGVCLALSNWFNYSSESRRCAVSRFNIDRIAQEYLRAFIGD